MSKMRSILTHALIDAPHLADGLFVLTRGQSNRGMPKVQEHGNVTVTSNRIVRAQWKEIKIMFACGEPLGVTEQSVLLALVARAGLNGTQISAGGNARSRELHALLRPAESDGRFAPQNGVMIETSIPELCADSSLSKSGTAYAAVEDALRRLGNVVVTIHDTTADTEGNTLMIAWRRRSERVEVAMNYRIRDALLNTGFTRVSLTERAKLRTGCAKLVHTFLSRWAGRGKRSIGLDTLATHVWDDGLGADKTQRRDRRRALRSALAEIIATGAWTIETEGSMLLVSHIKPSGEKTTHRKVRKPPTGGEETTHRGRARRGTKVPAKSGVFANFAA